MTSANHDMPAVPSGEAVDLTTCEREPIHIPGAVQPHGMLLVLSEPGFDILQTTANAGAVAGIAPGELLGRNVDVLLDEAGMESLRKASATEFTDLPFLLLPLYLKTSPGGTFEGALHRNEAGLLLELQPVPGRVASLSEALRLTQNGIAAFEACGSVSEFCSVAASYFRRLTGFDRVLVYRFDEEWHGEVVGEDQNGAYESYLGLYFPASDIPAQARALYHRNRLRLITDRDAPPAPLVPVLSPRTGAPVDLSLCSLRSVSPIHLEYLRNMGVAASMSVALTVGGRLWGLISFHHREPLQLPFEMIAACQFLGRVASQRLTVLQSQEEFTYRARLRRLQAQFVEFMGRDPVKGELSQYGEYLLDFLAADGFAMIADDGVTLVGNTPSRVQVEELQSWLVANVGDEVFSTDHFVGVYAPAEQFKDAACGLLAFSIAQLPHAYAIWFRPERIRTINWGGDPRKPVEPGTGPTPDRLHPRKSFELFKETVRDRSTPWRRTEIEAAIELRSLITGVILLVRKARELAKVNEALEYSVRELDQFAYVTSHDLRAPLRGISSLSKWIEEDLGSNITPETRKHLELMRGRVQRMEDMIGAILAYSRVGRIRVEVEDVDVGGLLGEIVDLLAPPPGFRIEIGEGMPTIHAEKMRVQQVFMNLISNAIKHYGASEGVITVAVRDEGKFYEFSVADQGQGIDPRYHDRIFGMFQTLQSRDKVEGTGIGLALVKKIVDGQGGEIRVESEPDKGTTFRFTWPKRATVADPAVAPVRGIITPSPADFR